MELLLYLWVLILSIYSTFFGIEKGESKFRVYWSALMICSSLIIRNNFQSDIIVYAREMKAFSLNFYLLREPILWYGQKLIYQILKSDYLTFVLIDFIFIQIIFEALKNLKSPKFIYYSIFLSFPFILGFQNIYRQWAAQCLLLYILSLSKTSTRSSYKKLFLLFVASLIHNVSFIFLPLILAQGKSKSVTFRSLLFLLLITILLIQVRDTKTQASTGYSLELLYGLFFTILSLAPLLFDRLRIKVEKFKFYQKMIFLTLIGLIGLAFLSSTASERIFIFILFLAYPFLILEIEKNFLQKPFIRIVYIFIFFIPILLFNVREFILK